MISKRKTLTALLAVGLVIVMIAAACGEDATPTPVPEVVEEAGEEPIEEVLEDVEEEPVEEVMEEEVVEEEPVEEVMEEEAVGEQPLPGGTLRVTYGDDPPTWDLRKTTSYAAGMVSGFIHVFLTRWDMTNPQGTSDFTPRSELAEYWDVSEDGLTVTFHLRRGIKFQDIFPVNGREVVADDVVFSYNQFLAPDAPNRALLGPVTNVSAPDDYTVVFEFSVPHAAFLTYTSHTFFPILAPEVLDEFGDFSTAESAIGAGAFILESHDRGVEMIFVKNPDYFRGENGITGESLPYIDRIEAYNIPDRDAREAMYRSGEIDEPGSGAYWGFWNVWGPTLEIMAENNPELVENLRTFSDTACQLYAFAPNVDTFPFMNQKVRQAVSMVVDRGDAWTVVSGPWLDSRELSSRHPWFVPLDELGEGAAYYPVDEEGNYVRDIEGGLARLNEGLQELIDAGEAPEGFEIGDRISVDLNMNSEYGEGIQAGGELIVSWLNDLNFDVTIRGKVYAEYVSTTMIGDFEGLMFGWNHVCLDPDEGLFGLYHPDSLENKASVNDPELTPLLDAQRAELDVDARGEIIKEIQRLMAVKQYMWQFPAYVVTNAFPDYINNVGPQKKYDVGGMWLSAWLTEDAPGRQ